ncbi:hypothetical protein MJT46_004198 [Ovis ammon polii x Ovis aries]|nr:hypothetical protein MJT46_004198 [Ovis ammon polii x Ovis aries]
MNLFSLSLCCLNHLKQTDLDFVTVTALPQIPWTEYTEYTDPFTLRYASPRRNGPSVNPQTVRILNSFHLGGEECIISNCVRGWLMEVNVNIFHKPSSLQEKPSTEGYIAVVLPKFEEIKYNLDFTNSYAAVGQVNILVMKRVCHGAINFSRPPLDVRQLDLLSGNVENGLELDKLVYDEKVVIKTWGKKEIRLSLISFLFLDPSTVDSTVQMIVGKSKVEGIKTWRSKAGSSANKR